jgi:hypothetical protein
MADWGGYSGDQQVYNMGGYTPDYSSGGYDMTNWEY